MRMVLGGTAGRPDYGWGAAGQTTQWSIEQCEAMQLGGLFGQPGSTIDYSSCDTLVLGTIISRSPRCPGRTS